MPSLPDFNPDRPTSLFGIIAILIALLHCEITVPRCDAGVVVFGDSLSDTGNLFLASRGAPVDPFAPDAGARFPSPPFAAGLASNGTLWVDVMAQRLGEPTPGAALAGGTNFAFIGALTGPQVASPFGVPSLSEQVGLYLLSTGGVAAATDLHVLWGGANDFFFGQVNPFLAVSNLSNQIQTLAGAGASEFLVPNLIPLNQTPSLAGTPVAPAAAGFSQAFNVALANELGSLRTNLGVTIHELDVAGLFAEVNSDPAEFGLTNVTDPALSVELSSSLPTFPFDVAANTDEYLWWDGVHPTAAAHELIGSRAAGLVNPVPEPSSMMTWAVVVVGCLGRTRRRKDSRGGRSITPVRVGG